MFWGNQIKGKKGWTQRPLKAADSSPDMCLKRDAATDAKNRGKEGKGENGQSLREENEGKIKEREEGDRKLQQAKQERKVYKTIDNLPKSRILKTTFTTTSANIAMFLLHSKDGSSLCCCQS